VDILINAYGVKPSDLHAVISPSLGPCCAEFISFAVELPSSLHGFQVRPNHFDFWKISRAQLMEAGLPDHNIETVGICTCCDGDFFSYRRSMKGRNPTTGRCGSVIALV